MTASIMIKIEIGMKNVRSIPNPKQVMAIPTNLLSLRILISPRKFMFCFLYYYMFFIKKG